MKKSIFAVTFVGTILCACLTLQSCADTTYGETPYVTSTTTYGPYGAHYWSTTEPESYSYYGSYPTYAGDYYSYPQYRTTYSYPTYASAYPTYPTYSSEPDSVVGSTAHAVGTIIAAPFRIVGDAVDTIF